MKVAVYLSARENIAPAYKDAARQVGLLLGRDGHTLIYGGAAKGTMEILAQAAHEGGARVVGVVPEIIRQRGLVSRCLDEDVPCHDLSDRKALMNASADVLLILPGGIGTLDELFTALGEHTIGLARHRVILLNVAGIWDPLLALIRSLHAQGFCASPEEMGLQIAQDLDDLAHFLQ